MINFPSSYNAILPLTTTGRCRSPLCHCLGFVPFLQPPHIHRHHLQPLPPVPRASSPSLVVTSYEQVVGSERAELLGDLSGRSAFLTAPSGVDHHGALKDPSKVGSVEGACLVGCTSFPKHSHEPMWLWVEHAHGPTRCIECGQALATNKSK